MATFRGDIRYKAKCFKCGYPLGDWALQQKEEERMCMRCNPAKINEVLKKFAIRPE